MLRRLVGGWVCVLPDYAETLCFYVSGLWHVASARARYWAAAKKTKDRKWFQVSGGLTSEIDVLYDVKVWECPFGFTTLRCSLTSMWDFFFWLKPWWSEVAIALFYWTVTSFRDTLRAGEHFNKLRTGTACYSALFQNSGRPFHPGPICSTASNPETNGHCRGRTEAGRAKTTQGEYVFSEQCNFRLTGVCFWDNRPSDKWDFSPMGHFLEYWVFRMGHENNGTAPLQAWNVSAKCHWISLLIYIDSWTSGYIKEWVCVHVYVCVCNICLNESIHSKTTMFECKSTFFCILFFPLWIW